MRWSGLHRPLWHSVDLAGDWEFAWSDEPVKGKTVAALKEAGLRFHPCKVPGNFELDLQAIGEFPQPFFGMNIVRAQSLERTHVWYTRSVTTEDRPGTTPQVLVGPYAGYLVVRREGMPALSGLGCPLCGQIVSVPKDANAVELLIGLAPNRMAHRPTPPGVAAQACNYDSLYNRQEPHAFGWDIMPRVLSRGIWRSIDLVDVPDERVDHLHLRTISATKESAKLVLHYNLVLKQSPLPLTDSPRYEIRIKGRCEGSEFRDRRPLLDQAGKLTIDVPNPKLWWPRGRGKPNLYDVSVSLLKDGEEIDRAELRYGIRTVQLDRTSVTSPAGDGQFQFVVNGERVFILGTNWVPADAFHSRDAERIPQMMELAEEVGVNMIRCWGGNVYENDLFYDLCDEKGILVWQDFAMACAVYPQDWQFRETIAAEARHVVRRLRNHACLALWCGDNECDTMVGLFELGDPNRNVLTREVIPSVLHEEAPGACYLPSSPYIDAVANLQGEECLPERHLWGPRDYYKSPFYTEALCHFASEIGYHGCPSEESVRQFISADKLWPPQNEEWILHCTSPIPGADLYDYRVELMLKQVRNVFGTVPDNLAEFSFASQAVQAEALKFFVEWFRMGKWRRTGIIWWNLIDGWPQFSDAVVDYFFRKKLAFDALKRAQQPVLLALSEPEAGSQAVLVCNDTREAVSVHYKITDLESEEVVKSGVGEAFPDAVTPIGSLPVPHGTQTMFALEWTQGRSHYLLGEPPFDLGQYCGWLRRAR